MSSEEIGIDSDGFEELDIWGYDTQKLVEAVEAEFKEEMEMQQLEAEYKARMDRNREEDPLGVMYEVELPPRVAREKRKVWITIGSDLNRS